MFQKNIFKFPYFISYLKNFKFNSNIFYNLILDKIFKTMILNYKGGYYNHAYSTVLKNNIKEAHLYYENYYFKKEFSKLIKYMDVPIPYIINDTRKQYEFNKKTYSGYKKTDIFNLLNKNIIIGKLEDVCNLGERLHSTQLLLYS